MDLIFIRTAEEKAGLSCASTVKAHGTHHSKIDNRQDNNI